MYVYCILWSLWQISIRLQYYLQVINSSVESDFFSSTAVASFTEGVTTASAILLLQNDAIPEGNETFIVNITGKRYGQ